MSEQVVLGGIDTEIDEQMLSAINKIGAVLMPWESEEFIGRYMVPIMHQIALFLKQNINQLKKGNCLSYEIKTGDFHNE